MAVAHDADSTSGYQTPVGSTVSWNHAAAGSAVFLAVDVAMLSLAGITVSSVAYVGGGTSSLIGVRASGTGTVRVECWGFTFASPPEAGNITVTFSSTLGSGAVVGSAVSYTGVDQSLPTEAFNSDTATNVGAADATVTITTTSERTWVHGAVAATDTSVTANQTTRNNSTGALGSGADEDNNAAVSPPAATAMSYTGVGAGATWSIAGYAIRPEATFGQGNFRAS